MKTQLVVGRITVRAAGNGTNPHHVSFGRGPVPNAMVSIGQQYRDRLEVHARPDQVTILAPSSEGGPWLRMRPDEARALAHLLTDAADTLEREAKR